MNQRERNDLDRWITGNYGEDQFKCTCYHTTDNDGVIHPVLCEEHQAEKDAVAWRQSTKYSRFFASHEDAKDRAKIIMNEWPAAGYGTIATIDQVGRWWWVQAWWAENCD